MDHAGKCYSLHNPYLTALHPREGVPFTKGSKIPGVKCCCKRSRAGRNGQKNRADGRAHDHGWRTGGSGFQ